MLADHEVDRSNWLVRAVLAGFCATIVMIVVFFYGYAVAVPISHLRLADANGALGSVYTLQAWFSNLIHNHLIDVARNEFYGALALHGAVGIFWAVVYACFAEPRLGGRGWLRGMLFSLIPWFLSLVVFLPLAGAGFFGLRLDAGPLPALGNLLMHLAYGATLGAVYAPASQRLLSHATDVDAGLREQAALRRAEGGAMLGLVTGLVGGLVLGLTLLFIGQVNQIYTSVGLAESGVLVATTIGGACLGGLVGALTALPGVPGSRSQGSGSRTTAVP